MLATNVRRLQNYGRFLSIHPVFHLLSSYGISASSLRCKNSKKNELVHGQTIAPPRGGAFQVWLGTKNLPQVFHACGCLKFNCQGFVKGFIIIGVMSNSLSLSNNELH